MYKSAFEKFGPVDEVLGTYPIHANEYAEQISSLELNLGSVPATAEAKLNLIAKRILTHKDLPQNWNACIPCKSEPMSIRKVG